MIHGAPVNVKDFGATGDGSTDDTVAIQAALAAGGVIYFPSGTYMTDYITFTGSNIKWHGESRQTTILKLNAGQNNHVINFVNAFNCSIESMTIFQDYTNNPTAGHGLRLAGTTDLVLNDLLIKESHSYGIGIQAGANINTQITNFKIDDCGRDGIDIKDYNFLNSITISDGFITGHGRDATVLQQVGIDVRGYAVVNNVHIETTNENATRGLRLRSSGVQGNAASGSFSNIFYRSAFSDSGNIGLDISDTCSNYTVSNFTTDGGSIGGLLNGSGGVINGMAIKNAGLDGIAYGGQNLTINGLFIDTTVARAIDIEPDGDNLVLNGFQFLNIGIATLDVIRIQAGGTNTSIYNGIIESGYKIVDSGTDSKIRNVVNFATEVNVISADVLVDSTGAKTVDIPYTLGTGVTPNEQDVAISVIRSTGDPIDYAYDYVHIVAASSTYVRVSINITTASATVGAAIKIGAVVKTKV